MEGIFMIKKFVSLCLFLAHIDGNLCASEPPSPRNPPNVRDDKSTELSWKVGDFHAFKGYELTNNTLTTIPVSDYFDCVTACLAEQRCCSVNFKPEGISICNLNKRCRRERQEDGCMKRSDHAVYYELSNTKGWDVAGDPCRYSPCLNGGRCILTERCNGYKCICHSGNTGEHCEHWKDDASDFDIKLFYGSGKDYASFNFSSTRYSAEKRWLGYTVCFWVKIDMDPKSDSTFFTYVSTSGKQVFRVTYAEDSSKLSFKGYDNERLVDFKAPEVKDKSWHHICAMWENRAGMASLFVDNARRERVQGKLVGLTFPWDGVLIFGDKKADSKSSKCTLTCLRFWEGVITDEEVKRAYGDKKCNNKRTASMMWPLFKRADFQGNALWTNSSSLWKEDLDFEVTFKQGSYISMDSFSFPSLSSLTVCLWESSISDHPSKMSVVSYSKAADSHEFVMDMKEASGKLFLTAAIDGVSGTKTYSTEVFKNGFWNHLCLAWQNIIGDYAFFINGTKVVKGVLQVANSIPANGLLIIGGQKSPAHLENPFVGKMRCVQMWDNYLPDSGIAALFQNDRCEKLFQPFFNWNEVKSGTAVGDVEWKEPSSFTEPDKAPDEDFDAVFPTGSSDSYLMIESVPVSQLTSLTVSLWLKIYDCSENHIILVYSTPEHEKEISLKLEKFSPVSSWVCKLSITMKNVELDSKYILLTNTNWRFIAFTWKSSGGNYDFYLDATSSKGFGIFKDQNIKRGKILIGQQEGKDEQQTKNPFAGRIACLQMWKTDLTAVQITNVFNGKRAQDGTCQTQDDSNRFLTWAQVKNATAKGEVSLSWPSRLV